MKARSFIVEAIKTRSDLRNVVERYTDLDKRGRGLCPFHPEETPSFFVSDEKQLFHCFGCKAGGDVIKFVQLVESLTFRQALARLSRWFEVGATQQPTISSWESARTKLLADNEFFEQIADGLYELLVMAFRRLPPRDQWTAKEYTRELMLEEAWTGLDETVRERKLKHRERMRSLREKSNDNGK